MSLPNLEQNAADANRQSIKMVRRLIIGQKNQFASANGMLFNTAAAGNVLEEAA